jgi:hypothetical protein
MDDDYRCDEEFNKLVDLNVTDMDLLEIAFEEEVMVDNWEDGLWAVSIDSYDYDLLPQFDGAEEVHLEDGDNITIWWTGWQWYSSCNATATSTTAGTITSGGSTGFSSDAESKMPTATQRP